MTNQTPVFVYGTLREGFGNHERILEGNIVSSQPAILQGYDMYSVGGGGFPAIIPAYPDSEVVGELMIIKESIYRDILMRLDHLEGYNERNERSSMYLRRTMKVIIENGDEIEAGVYLWNRSIPGPLVESGDWKEFTKNRRPALNY